jgi:hypothetical protein
MKNIEITDRVYNHLIKVKNTEQNITFGNTEELEIYLRKGDIASRSFYDQKLKGVDLKIKVCEADTHFTIYSPKGVAPPKPDDDDELKASKIDFKTFPIPEKSHPIAYWILSGVMLIALIGAFITIGFLFKTLKGVSTEE